MISPTLLYRGTLGSSAVTVATTTTNGQTTINSIVATNKTANARVFSITVGGVYFAYLMPIAAYQTITLDIRQVANPGTAIQAWADAVTAVDLSISCAIQTPVLFLGSGTGSPEGVLTASQGAEWVQTNDSQLTYLKWRKLTGSGNTGWYPDFEGRWKTYTPTITQSVSVGYTNQKSIYCQVGKMLQLYVSAAITGTGTAGNPITATIPVTASLASSGGGSWWHYSSGVNNNAGYLDHQNTTSVRLIQDGNGNIYNGQLKNGDFLSLSMTYEVA